MTCASDVCLADPLSSSCCTNIFLLLAFLQCMLTAAAVVWLLFTSGVLFGERVVKYQDTIVFRDDRNDLE